MEGNPAMHADFQLTSSYSIVNSAPYQADLAWERKHQRREPEIMADPDDERQLSFDTIWD
jgi:hypothetical protein